VLIIHARRRYKVGE